MSASVIESVAIQSVHCDGLAAVHIRADGMARINLYAEQIDMDGRMERVLVSRLTMSADTMAEIAGLLLQERMTQAARRAGMAMRVADRMN